MNPERIERLNQLKATGADGEPCAHHWERIARWYGRYKCVRCGAIGYRVVAVASPTFDGKPLPSAEQIIPYACSYRGCLNPAYRSKPRKLCKTHGRNR